jgi:hypothetical protein
VLTAFALESQQHLKFSNIADLTVRLDSNVWVTTTDRLSSVRWDNQRSNFVLSTRENAIKVYSLDTTNGGTGLWTPKVSVLVAKFLYLFV